MAAVAMVSVWVEFANANLASLEAFVSLLRQWPLPGSTAQAIVHATVVVALQESACVMMATMVLPVLISATIAFASAPIAVQAMECATMATANALRDTAALIAMK